MAKVTKNDEASGFDFDSATGREASGSKGSVLNLEIGESIGPIVVTSIQENVFLDDSPGAHPVTCYGARTMNGIPLRLPVAAIFVSKCKELGVKIGDKIAIQRVDDVLKTKGRGKGNPMKDFRVKVLD